jgi:ABC-type branched-subunit amino acid transport system ATPase component
MPTSRVSESARPAPFLQVEGVTAGYSNAPVVWDITISVGLGEVVAILGPNGAGKSTFVKSVVGHLRVSSGAVQLDGSGVTNLASEDLARSGLGYVPQIDDIFPALTVEENLEIGGYLLERRGLPSRIAEVVALFPALAPMLKRGARSLSGGERKQLAIARALMLRPRVLVLDEPTASLSPKLSESLLRDHVRRLANTGTAVLMVEQKVAAALAIADWAYLLVAGKNALDGSAQSLRSRSDFAQLFLGRRAVSTG